MAEISSTSEEPTPSAAAAVPATAVTPDATPTKKKGSVADRVAWLQNAFNKDKDSSTPSKRDIGLESSTTSVSDRKRWMEEEAFRKHLEERGMDTPSTSHASVVAERRRWLDEQAERNRLENEKNQINSRQQQQQPQQGLGSPARGGGNKDNSMKEDAANGRKEEATNEEETPKDETNEAEPSLVEEAGVSVDEEVVSAAENDSDKEKAPASPTAADPIAPSKSSRPSSQDPPIQTTASTMMRATETAGTGGSAMPCLFSSPVFAQQRDQMEFFLPAACSCPKCRAELAATAAADGGEGEDDATAAAADPTSLKTILRPWQVEFLASEGITTAQALVDVEKDADRRLKLCKQMKRWRKERDLPAKTISCLMACRIWAKTSEETLMNAK